MPDIDAAFSEALDEIRATLHRLAERLEQDHFAYDMRGPMNSAHDMLSDFQPVIRAREDAEAARAARARAEERDLWREGRPVL